MLVPWLVEAAAGGDAVAWGWGEGGRAPSHGTRDGSSSQTRVSPHGQSHAGPILLTTPSRMLEHWTSGPAWLAGRPVGGALGPSGRWRRGERRMGTGGSEGGSPGHLALLGARRV